MNIKGILNKAILRLERVLPSHVSKLIRKFTVLPFRRWFGPKIPVAMITGSSGKTTTTRMLALILSKAGHRVGFTSTNGIAIDWNYLSPFDSAGYHGAAVVLSNPAITAAVLEVARKGLKREGLYLDRCTAAALLNVDREQIGTDGINTVEEMANHKRQVVDAAQNTVVLNADDTQCVKIIREFPTQKLILFSFNPESSAFVQHLARNGVGYSLGSRGDISFIQRHQGETTKELITTFDLPACENGLFPQNIANAMAAAALAEGMQAPFEAIRAGLRAYTNSIEHAPGRFNFIDGFSVKVLLDRAVSVPASRALAESVARITVPGRKICVIEGSDSRPGWYYAELTSSIAEIYNYFICLAQDNNGKTQIKRRKEEVLDLLEQGLLKAGVNSQSISKVTTLDDALIKLAEIARPGDLLVIALKFPQVYQFMEMLELHLVKLKV